MRSVVAAHQCDQPTLYGNTIRSKNSCFVGRVSGFKRDRRAFTAQALQCGFLTINERNDNIAGARRLRPTADCSHLLCVPKNDKLSRL